MRFKSGKEMLDVLSQHDLYNKEKEMYVFSYNGNGSIAYYNLDNAEMNKLRAKTLENETYVGSMLGPGGHIADDPSCEYFNEGDYSNLDWCNDNYNGEWKKVS